MFFSKRVLSKISMIDRRNYRKRARRDSPNLTVHHADFGNSPLKDARIISKISTIRSENHRERSETLFPYFPLINLFSSTIITKENSGG